MKNVGFLASVTWCFLVVGFIASMVAAADTADRYFTIDSDGKLERPAGFREWVHVDTRLVPPDGDTIFPRVHNVYMDPGSWRHWKRTGTFREGTILVKELIGVGSESVVTMNGHFLKDSFGLEAAIKSRKHFPSNRGNWACFSLISPDRENLAPVTDDNARAICDACLSGSTEHGPTGDLTAECVLDKLPRLAAADLNGRNRGN